MQADDKNKLREVFDSFDADKSGFIQLKEIQKAAQDLGSPIAEDKLHEIMDMLDTNEDGKISFEEFEFWWVNGHKGQLGELIALRKEVNKKTKKFMEKIKQAQVDPDNIVANQGTDKYEVDLLFGKEISLAISVSASVQHRSPRYAEVLGELKKSANWLNEDSFNLVLVVGCPKSEEVKNELVQFLNEVVKAEFMPVKVDNVEENDLIGLRVEPVEGGVAIHFEVKPPLLRLFDQPISQFDKTDGKLGEESYVDAEVCVKTNFSIADLFDDENILETVLKGISVTANIQVPHSATKKGREYVEKTEVGNQEPFNLFISLLLNRLKLRLRLKSPHLINKFFQKMGIKELINQCPTLSELLDQVSLLEEVVELKKNQEDPKHTIYKFLRLVNKFVEQRVTVYVQRQRTITKVDIRCPNASRVFQAIFNEL